MGKLLFILITKRKRYFFHFPVGPKGYKFRRWVFDWGKIGIIGWWVRACGSIMQMQRGGGCGGGS
jgi:hypothetical protein